MAETPPFGSSATLEHLLRATIVGLGRALRKVRVIKDHLVAAIRALDGLFRQLLRIGILVDAVNRRDEPVFQLARDSFVGGQHEFLDELMRFVVLDSFERDWFSIFVETDFYLGKIKV